MFIWVKDAGRGSPTEEQTSIHGGGGHSLFLSHRKYGAAETLMDQVLINVNSPPHTHTQRKEKTHLQFRTSIQVTWR